ncbi:MAG: MmcQ/YjbR family DNA-binding protein, partial [Sandaracinaceae bacterium]
MSKDRIRVHDRALEELRAHGLRFPGAHLKSPWPEHKDLAVNDKTFAYMGHGGDALGLSCKLPHSNREALMLEGATPGAYGLGKSGWVAITFPLESDPPVEMLKEWLEESYRAQAPKKLVKQLDAERGGASEPVGKAPNKKAPNKKATAKKAADR